jgi:hypothetical protein
VRTLKPRCFSPGRLTDCLGVPTAVGRPFRAPSCHANRPRPAAFVSRDPPMHTAPCPADRPPADPCPRLRAAFPITGAPPPRRQASRAAHGVAGHGMPPDGDEGGLNAAASLRGETPRAKAPGSQACGVASRRRGLHSAPIVVGGISSGLSPTNSPATRDRSRPGTRLRVSAMSDPEGDPEGTPRLSGPSPQYLFPVDTLLGGQGTRRLHLRGTLSPVFSGALQRSDR